MKCDYCDSDRFITKLDNYKQCVRCGITYRVSDIKEFKIIPNDMQQIFDLDMTHYTNKVMQYMYSYYNNILSCGGGIPKLESLLSNNITVIDTNADMYSQFCRENLPHKNITYINMNILKYLTKYLNNLDTYDLITYVHILEHLNYNTILKILSIDTQNNILIYQPNPDTNDRYHYNDTSHLTFIPLPTFEDILINLGYKILLSKTIDLDLLILAEKGL
jgi:hypothetical protein